MMQTSWSKRSLAQFSTFSSSQPLTLVEKASLFYWKWLSGAQTSITPLEFFELQKVQYWLYNDKLKDQAISRAQVLNICKSQLHHETDVGVLTAVVQRMIPVIINSCIPSSVLVEKSYELFELILSILAGNTTLDTSTKTHRRHQVNLEFDIRISKDERDHVSKNHKQGANTILEPSDCQAPRLRQTYVF